MEKIESDVAEALTIIESNHVKGKKLDYNALFKSSIDSMLHTLDPHSNYFDSKEFEEFRTSQSSQYYGIGATIGDLSDAKGNVIATYIKATFDGAPANRAGLRYGDKIVEVNGVSMLGKPYFEVREFLRGPRGTAAKLVVERYNTGKREAVEIIRDAVSQPSIAEAYMIKPRIGYMAMTGGFNYTTYNEFREAMKQLKAQGMEQLILDLRNNGGGLVNQAYMVANTFLNSGQTVFTQKGRLDGSARTFQAENDSPENMPIVVLVNRNTASASEILAGALAGSRPRSDRRRKHFRKRSRAKSIYARIRLDAAFDDCQIRNAVRQIDSERLFRRQSLQLLHQRRNFARRGNARCAEGRGKTNRFRQNCLQRRRHYAR